MMERYYFVASSTFGEVAHTILHGKRTCHHIDHVSEDRLAVVSGDGTELRQSGNFGHCRDCTDTNDGVFP